MRGCVVCGVGASQCCGGCGNVSYCGVKHQKSHWADHKAACSPFKIEQSAQFGKNLIAGRNLSAGDLIIDEEVAVLGPTVDEGSPGVCLGCYFPTHGYKCSTCQAPLCGPTCETQSDHAQECEVLAKYDVCQKKMKDLESLISPLRFLLLKSGDTARFKKCMQLSANIEERKQQADFQITTRKAAEFCDLFPDLTTEEEITKILCIIDTNTYQVLSSGSAHSLSGLYPRVALLNHNCVPNSRLIFRADYSLQVRASVDIKKGSSVFISYTPPFFSLLARMNILQRGKQFLCSCDRCSDPTELGTFLSSIRCLKCLEGFYQPREETWNCTSCDNVLTFEEFSTLDAKLLSVQTRLDKENIEEMKEVLAKYSGKLHPNHALLTETKQHLAAALGCVDGYRYDQMNKEDLELKIKISYELLDICSILEPGISRSRGITLLDLTETKARLIQIEAKDEIKVLEELVLVEKQLKEAQHILQYEDENALEGNVAKQARIQLGQLRGHIVGLQGF
eukprot:GFUD01008283.1.p1 GENE.GFUD01008283.1~~GFUD01008283.1.p1  ORF type:complete len:508 (+),score=99.99 GFUD01008283.1:66-1589(+)